MVPRNYPTILSRSFDLQISRLAQPQSLSHLHALPILLVEGQAAAKVLAMQADRRTDRSSNGTERVGQRAFQGRSVQGS